MEAVQAVTYAPGMHKTWANIVGFLKELYPKMTMSNLFNLAVRFNIAAKENWFKAWQKTERLEFNLEIME